MKSHDCSPVSAPKLPDTHQHPMWDAWDLAVDICLSQLRGILELDRPYVPSSFFEEQLTAFEVWLSYGSEDRSPPEQLPIVLQVLLSQVIVLINIARVCFGDSVPIVKGAPTTSPGPARPLPGPRALGGQPGPQCGHFPVRAEAAAVERQGVAAAAGLHLGQDSGGGPELPARPGAGPESQVLPHCAAGNSCTVHFSNNY